MNELPLGLLIGALIILIAISAFFSGSETGMMALNRYRLRHLVREQNRGAIIAASLLDKPDRLIGLIMLCNNLVNFIAAAISSIIALRLYGESGILISTLLFTAIVVIFAEVTPKTVAALHPERVAFPASFVLKPLLYALTPLVWILNRISNGLLVAFGVSAGTEREENLSPAELRTVVQDKNLLLPRRHREMLVGVLDLEQVTVDDIMVPRNEINGLNLDDDDSELLEQVLTSQHTQMPVYRGDINDIEGVVHLRRLLMPIKHDEFSSNTVLDFAKEPYFVPMGTPLSFQLRRFQQHSDRVGLVVDEYGDIQGLVTLEDILEEVVGEFTTDPAAYSPDVHPQDDGTYLIDGSATVRELNRTMNWELPAAGPKTLNGLILEHLEAIPEAGTSVLLGGYPVEIVQATEHAVKTARINPVRPVRGSRESG